ncbi:MAG: glycoside hydrolase family 1 protein [Chloroflexi bacterium]|nr:glycoside hydrolase family 1 protein [Chloroflexota bacterium]
MVVEALGENVNWWITINEPMIFILHGYLLKMWPPGKSSPKALSRVMAHMAAAHCSAYKRIKLSAAKAKRSDVRVGLAHAIPIYDPADESSRRDRFAVRNRDLFMNKLFLRLLHHKSGYLPAYLFGVGGSKSTLDFIGVNYYFREFISGHSKNLQEQALGRVAREDKRYQNAKKSNLDWEIYPKGLYRALMGLKSYGVPLLVTENGLSTDRDEERWDYIQTHLVEVHRAIRDGAPVVGYLYWSLLDNFEWSLGYRPHFGLIGVEEVTGRRMIKPSAQHYALVCESNVLDLTESFRE